MPLKGHQNSNSIVYRFGMAYSHQPTQEGMGIFSLNPNHWGLTAEEVAVYEQQMTDISQAKIAAQSSDEILKAETSAKVQETDPSILAAWSGGVQQNIGTLSFGLKLLLWGGIGLTGVWVYREFIKDAGTERSIGRQFLRLEGQGRR